METNAPPIPLIPALPQFTPENLVELESARRGARKVRRAVSVASFDGWTLAIFGALTLAMGLTHTTNILLSLGLGAVAYVELRNAARLKRLQADAARTLGFNQLALAGILIIYALWQLYVASRSGGSMPGISDAAQTFGAMPDVQERAQSIAQAIYAAFYWAIVIIAVCAQGSMALYYFSRAKMIRNYVAKTPEWIIKLQEAGFAL